MSAAVAAASRHLVGAARSLGGPTSVYSPSWCLYVI